MAKWINRSLVQAPRNGTTSHTVAFTPATAGNLLVMVMEGAVTHTVPTGWTRRNQALNSTELSVYTKTAAAGESSFTTTHNGGNYPIAVVVYEFPAGTTWSGGTSATGVAAGGVNPNLTGLTGTNLALAAAAAVVVSATPGTATWSTPTGITEDVDVSVGGGATDGYLLTVAYIEDHAGASFQPGGSISFSPFGGKETLTFAVKVAEGDSPVTITATLAGAGTLTASVVPAVGKPATLAGTGTLTAVVTPAVAKPGVLGGAGTLAVVVAPGVSRAANLAGTAALTAVSRPSVAITAQLAGAGALTGNLSASSDRAWSAALDGAGELMASLAPTVIVTATLTGTNALTTIVVPAINTTADLGAETTLTAALATGTTWDAGFTGEATLTVTIEKGRTLHTVYPATGTLTGTLTPNITITAHYTAEASLTEHAQEPNMAIPSPDWDLVTLKWAGTYLDGTPCTGRLKFAYNGTAKFMLDDDIETPLSIYTTELSVQLTTKTVLFEGAPREVGYAEIQVPASNDPDITGAGGTYTCTELLDRSAGRPPFKFVADINAEDRTIWLNKVETVA